MGGGGKTTTTTKSETRNTIAPWMEDASRGAVGIGQRIANREYTAFGGQRVAGLSGLEQQANQGAGQLIGQVTPGMVRTASGSIADADMNRYMNPYLQNVTARQRSRVEEDAAREMSGLARRGDMIKAFGGDRYTLMEEGIRKRRDETLADIDERGLASAFGNAQQMAMADRTSAQGFITGALGAAREAGKSEREIDQMEKDFEYFQYIEGRDWDVNNLGPLLSAIGSAKFSTTESKDSTTTEQKSGSKLGGIVGGLAAIGSMFIPGGALAATALGKTAFGGFMGGVGQAAGALSGVMGGGK